MQRRQRLGGRRIRYGLLALVTLVGWVTVACGGDGDNDAAVEADGTDASGRRGADGDNGDGSQPDRRDTALPGDLIGRTFVAESVIEGGEERPVVDGTEIVVGFPEEGRITASAGCNGMGAPIAVDHGQITLVEDLGRTLKLCEPQELMDQEEWLVGFLQAGPNLTLDGAQLTLEGDDTGIQLLETDATDGAGGADDTDAAGSGTADEPDTATADPAPPAAGVERLPGTTWQVTELIDGDTTTSVSKGIVATITFEADGSAITVKTCNGGGGNVEMAKTHMTFGPVAMTRMLCPGEQGKVESAMLTVLRNEVAYRLEGDTLALRHPNGTALTLRPA